MGSQVSFVPVGWLAGVISSLGECDAIFDKSLVTWVGKPTGAPVQVGYGDDTT
ncbi:MAG: hypothetical protein ACLP1Y_13610 [Candidatus Acidiferrales bacterium]